jgi:hypothetical protein
MVGLFWARVSMRRIGGDWARDEDDGIATEIDGSMRLLQSWAAFLVVYPGLHALRVQPWAE